MPGNLQHADRRILLDAFSDSPQFATVRGRQTIVRNALGGYALSGETDKVLRFLDWEGPAIEVAHDLIHLIEGQEASPGVPALALLAQAMEPMAGMAHRDKLRDLRRRLGWGAVDPSPLAAENWRDQRPLAELVEERIIGENTLRPLYYLRRALVAADAVVRIDLNAVPKGTGFLVAPNLMMTNHHVIGTQMEARSAQACFYDEVADEQNKGEFKRQQVVARGAGQEPLVYTNPRLDVSLVRLKGAPLLVRCLALRPVVVQQNDRVVIIQHPGGYPKQISLQNNLVAAADALVVQYYTSTRGGSSGSPVLDDDFAVVAIHCGYVHNKEWDGGGQIRGFKDSADLQYRNEGRSMIALLEDLATAVPHLVSELTVLAAGR